MLDTYPSTQSIAHYPTDRCSDTRMGQEAPIIRRPITWSPDPQVTSSSDV